MTGADDRETETTRYLDDIAVFARGIAFPAARSDLLLQAILAHATPRLIGELRSLPDSVFADADALRGALRDR
ncbi:DUF2795 domain-containing protein [Labedella populi]|uniref:DUF2795 domain-containing protein n=1 Tax=Labedella populi TaxID=2498850 RepID=A0A3S5CLX3_9MICO|nr:DUF2795 domain-containing protein [Labedella populi]RWZ64272.1 DUF2795 domain-containing protein [Labedella populi]